MTSALELRGIAKHFGKVHACKDVDLNVAAGTIHAVVGENGAGKSTLMNIAYGLVRADAGDIRIKGKAVDRRSHSPATAIANGVGMVHQHFMLVGSLTVVENTILGNEATSGGLLDLDNPSRQLAELAQRHGLDVEPEALVDDLSVGEQQRVEILKVLWRGSDVLILDEPTAVLTPAEVKDLFVVLRALVADGATIVIITHKLDEVTELADRVTVMRRGENVAELEGDAISASDIARAMVGRPVLTTVGRTDDGDPYRGGPVNKGEGTAFELEDLVVLRNNGLRALDGVSVNVRAGEIVGVAGVEGNGQTELVEAIAGLRASASGAIRIAGQDVTNSDVRTRFALGLCHVPEDRHRRGLVLDFPLSENAILGRQVEFGSRYRMDWPAVDKHARGLIEQLDIRPDDPDAIVRGLSGGNQQKVVVARELTRPNPRFLVCAQPTRGVDIGAIELIHRGILDAREKGLGILLLSAELSELRALCDRLIVMYRGRIVAELTRREFHQAGGMERVGMAMTGASPEHQEQPRGE